MVPRVEGDEPVNTVAWRAGFWSPLAARLRLGPDSPDHVAGTCSEELVCTPRPRQLCTRVLPGTCSCVVTASQGHGSARSLHA